VKVSLNNALQNTTVNLFYSLGKIFRSSKNEPQHAAR